MKNWVEIAKEHGFDEAVFLKPEILISREDIRDMCAADKCGAYNRSWSCPPVCGTIEACQAKIRGYKHGILLQTVGYMKKTIDSKCYRETELRHMRQFYDFADTIRCEYPDVLCLGSGSCRICTKCAFPETCRFPEKAMSSMEAYGLFVTQVCRDCGVPYNHGEKTIAYTACVLF